ncbi:MAG: tetratricopeptide repeat protein [Gaiellaceae bacterium]
MQPDLPETIADETIGQRLRRLRLERGLSQRELSAPGVSYAYISRIEAGARRPSVKALRMLAPKLGISVEYLETGRDLSDDEERELRLADAELELRLADDPSGAEQKLQGIFEEARRAGDPVAATRARLALGLSAARDGRNSEAVALLEDVTTTSPTVSPVSHPNVYATLGRCYAALGRPDQAAELFERCRDEVRERAPDYTGALIRFATYLANSLSDMGEFERAQSVLQDVMEESIKAHDPYVRVNLYWSLGRIAARKGDSAVSLDYMRRAIATLEATEDTSQLARAHLVCAWIYISSGRAPEAGPHLELAERLLGPHAEPLDLAYLRTEQAKQAVAIGDPSVAVQRAREALETLGDSDPQEQGGAWLALARGLALQGETEEAQRAFDRSISLLEAHGERREHVEALRMYARFLREQGRESDALDVLERATALAVPTDQPQTRVKA